jgi:hypothetical protein
VPLGATRAEGLFFNRIKNGFEVWFQRNLP